MNYFGVMRGQGPSGPGWWRREPQDAQQMLLERGVLGPSVKILCFLWVGAEVVDFKLLRFHDVGDQFVLLGANAAAGTYCLRIRPLEVLVVPLFAERWGGRLRQRQDAFSLHVCGNWHAGEVKKGRREVGVENHLIADCSGRDALRVAHHERHTDRWLMHEAFVEEPPLTEEEAVVGAMKDGRFVKDVLPFEIAENAADIFIHRY